MLSSAGLLEVESDKGHRPDIWTDECSAAR